jgi:dTDP-4-dehydrorhamnose reductase
MFLVIGGDSEIGAAALRRLAGAGAAVTGTTRRPDRVAAGTVLLDLARPPGDWPVPPGIGAACLCAAVARLADCAADPIGSARINVEHSVALAQRLSARGIYTLFLSTNQVFDGATAHVAPETPPAPVSAYGHQKARTEAALLQQLERGAPIGILRLAKVVSPEIALLRGWAAALGAGRPIRAFADMMMAPTPIGLVAAAIDGLMRAQATGIFQLSGPRDVSYAEIGRYIAQRIGASPRLVEPIPAASAGMPEGSTPPHTTMDSARLLQRFGIQVPAPWQVVDGVIGAAPVRR